MKILFVHCMSGYEGQGGAEITLWYLMRALAAAGHHCKLAAVKPGYGSNTIRRDGIEVIEIGLKNIYWPYGGAERSAYKRIAWHALDSFNIFMKRALQRVCADFKPDVASVHNLPGWSIVAWDALLESGVPAVQVLHDYYPACVKRTMYRDGHNCVGQCTSCRLFRLPHRRKSRRLAAVVGVSRFILDRHILLGYFKHVPVRRVINNARHAEQLGSNRQVRRDADGRFRFGFIGSVTQVKGIEVLLNEFLDAEIDGAELWIAGNGNPRYMDQLRQKTVGRQIKFCGRIAPSDFYPQVDVVVLPSLWNDTFPGVAFEALAFGKPVIGAKRGGIPEMISDGENGLLFDPEESGGLRRCLERVTKDKTLLRELTSCAAPSAEKFLDTEAWIDAYLEVYQAVSSSRA
jgi:glycosyltransferase involved in cell wall biosynthesis